MWPRSLRKAEESTIMYKKVSFPVDFIFGEPEKELVKLLYDYETILINAAETLNPALIANYTFELAKEFNRFYQEIPVLKEKNALNRALRLQIAENCAEIIKKAQ